MTDVRADAQSTIALTAQVTAFLWTDFRAGAQTPTELTAGLTTFMKTDVRADAPTNTQLTEHVFAITFMCTYVRVHLTTFVRTDVRAGAQTTIRNVWIDRSANHITVNNIHEGRRSC